MSYVTSAVKCDCNELAVIKTGWTDDNPGRRFHSCFFGKGNGCNFFQWEDPPMCRRSRQIIPGLLRKIGRLEDEKRKMEVDLAKMEEGIAMMECVQNEVLRLKDEVAKKDCARRKILNLLIFMSLIALIFFKMWRGGAGSRCIQLSDLKMLA